MRTKLNRKDFVPARVNTSISPGEMLRTLRELQEMTQEQLAKAAKIPQSNISALESRVRQIGRERALALAKVLKVHPADILFPDYDVDEVP